MGSLRMRRLLPSAVELAIFATVALLCSAFVHWFQPSTSDLRFAALAGPIFLIAAVMGLRKSPTWTGVAQDEIDEA